MPLRGRKHANMILSGMAEFGALAWLCLLDLARWAEALSQSALCPRHLPGWVPGCLIPWKVLAEHILMTNVSLADHDPGHFHSAQQRAFDTGGSGAAGGRREGNHSQKTTECPTFHRALWPSKLWTALGLSCNPSHEPLLGVAFVCKQPGTVLTGHCCFPAPTVQSS